MDTSVCFRTTIKNAFMECCWHYKIWLRETYIKKMVCFGQLNFKVLGCWYKITSRKDDMYLEAFCKKVYTECLIGEVLCWWGSDFSLFRWLNLIHHLVPFQTWYSLHNFWLDAIILVLCRFSVLLKPFWMQKQQRYQLTQHACFWSIGGKMEYLEKEKEHENSRQKGDGR